MKLFVDGVMVNVKNGMLSQEEALAYVERGREMYGETLYEIQAEIDKEDPEFINLEYKWDHKPFHRLRRITGYLVGNLGRWNNAKRAEESDRVKHDAEGTRNV